MNRNQMELTFDAARTHRPVIRRQRRLSRARWWFDQMHSVVDRAADFQSASPTQAAQVSLTATNHS
jgi:hypothetical protein